MSRIYENWDRLVRATLRREEFRRSALRTPSDLTSASASVSESLSCLSFWSPEEEEDDDDDDDEEQQVLPSSSFSYRSFTYREIRAATNDFNPSNLIKHAKSGRLFRATLRNGTRVAVKIVEGVGLGFTRAIGIHKQLSHPRLVPLLGDVHNLLVYKYISKGDLSRNLHDLGWEKRLKIAIGAAEALEYLHHEFVPPLVHRNVQASSLLLDDDFEVRLGSLSYLCRTTDPNSFSTFGPLLYSLDYLKCQGFSGDLIDFDVYCFGGVLLELLTGKQGLRDSAPATDPVSGSASIDQNIPDLVLNIADPSLVIHEYYLTEIWGVFLVAKACLMTASRLSSNRLRMADIVSTLKLIKSARPETSGIIDPFSHFVHRALVTHLLMDTLLSGTKEDYRNWVNIVNQCFLALMDATRNFTIETVAESGINEGVFKAWFQRTTKSNIFYETLISVRLYHSQDMEVVYSWQSEMRMLGRLLHPNLVKFLGYFFKGNDLFLFHEFVQNGTLEQYLFKSSDTQPLSLEQRLKIMIGTARGLEFLHAAVGESFYENFDTSDILLDNDYNSKLLVFHKATRLAAADDIHEHCSDNIPPQHLKIKAEKTGFMPKQAEVDAFGVVLFEVLTGLSAKGYRVKGSGGAPRFVEFMVSRLSKSGHLESIMDSRLEEKYDVKTAAELVALALICTVPDPRARPSISEVLEKLIHIESALEEQKIQGKTQDSESVPGESLNNYSLL